MKLRIILKKICGELIFELFNKEDGVKGVSSWECYNHNIPSLRQNLKNYVIDAVIDELKNTYELKAKEFIAKEKFIDSVINRIFKKQLKN